MDIKLPCTNQRSAAIALIAGLLAVGAPGHALAQGPSAHGSGSNCASVVTDITAAAMALRSDPVVRRAIVDVKDRYFRPSLRPGDTQGAASLDAAADEMAFSALIDSASQSAPNALTWFLAPPHRETGRAVPVPGSRIIFDNPDRIYRFTPLKGDRRYEITGKIIDGKKPSLFVIEAVQSDNATGWGRPAAVLPSSDLDIAADGSFRITVGPDAADGRRNHLVAPANADAVLVRDTLYDWSRELPVQLAVRPLGDSAAPACAAPDDAVRRIEAYARKHFEWIGSGAPKEENRIGSALVRRTAGAAAWGVTAPGRFGLKPGQALVVTVDPLKARYLGVMLGDAWGRSIDYAHHTSSLNNSEVTPNADGTITYVISSEFPGRFNWLDAGGVRHGLVMIRWEFLQEPYDKAAKGEPVKVELTTISALHKGLSRARLAQALGRHRLFVTRHREEAYAARLKALYPAPDVIRGDGS